MKITIEANGALVSPTREETIFVELDLDAYQIKQALQAFATQRDLGKVD